MTEAGRGICLLGLAYLAGATPFGYLTARLVRGIDIRAHGSGNIGATNVGRVLGSKWGILVLLLDLLKGLLPVWLITGWLIPESSPNFWHWKVGAGMATIIGHMFPCWLKFRGGKGVATALGVAFALSPGASLAALLVFVGTFAIWRYVSLSSILGVSAYPVYEVYRSWPAPFAKDRISLAIFSLIAPLLIIFRHRANIGRLLRGEEPKYRSAKKEPDSPQE